MCKKLRNCLKCRVLFLSASVGERVCGKCNIKNIRIVITPDMVVSVRRKGKMTDP